MIGDAIAGEEQLKSGNRATKIALIQSSNSTWRDLSIEQPNKKK